MSEPERSALVYPVAAGAVPIKSLPAQLRPREEIDRVGVEHVSDVTLLAVILNSGTRGVNVVELASLLIRKYGSLTGLAAASMLELVRDRDIKGLGPTKARTLLAALEIGRRLSRETMPRQYRVRTPDDAVRLLREQVRGLAKEKFWALHLDAKNNLTGHPEVVSEGILDASLVHPREVFRGAIRSATGSVLLVHNHPSGDPTPSAEDIRVTRQLVEAGCIIDIRVLDHVVIGKAGMDGGAEYVSMREAGLVDFVGKR